MTYTTQPRTWTVAHTIAAPKTVKTKLPEAEENTCDIMEVYDSMNKLCETLGRLSCVLQRKSIEANLTGKGQRGIG